MLVPAIDGSRKHSEQPATLRGRCMRVCIDQFDIANLKVRYGYFLHLLDLVVLFFEHAACHKGTFYTTDAVHTLF